MPNECVCKTVCAVHDLWAWHPPVGVYIGILGFLGVLVTLVRDLTTIGKREKAAWIFVMFTLLLFEVKSVYQDRNEHDQQQADARERETKSFESNTVLSNAHDAIRLTEPKSLFRTIVGCASMERGAPPR
jgi:hypothetical protein